MLKLFRFPYFLFLLSASIASCTVFDPPTVIPAYGHIDSIHFTTYYDTQGTASATIPAAWVYLDDNPVGAFQIPCTFPMIGNNGVHNIKIYSGISAADANSAYNINPFYQFYSFNVTLQQGVITKFHPTSTYYHWVVFKLMEDFESPSEVSGGKPLHIIGFHGGGLASASTTTYMTVVNSPKSDVFQGGHSGRVVVTHNNHYFIGITDPADSLPHNGSTPVYLEANYKCTTFLGVGMFERDTLVGPISPVVLSATSTWKKMYVDLNTTIQAWQAYPNYRVYFSMQLDSVDGHTTDTLLLDNIKIIY